jgi:hypothetical protein
MKKEILELIEAAISRANELGNAPDMHDLVCILLTVKGALEYGDIDDLVLHIDNFIMEKLAERGNEPRRSSIVVQDLIDSIPGIILN